MRLIDQISRAADEREAIDLIVSYFKADSGTIYWLSADGLLHLAAATHGFSEAVLSVIRTIPVGKGMAGLAVERRQPVDACNIQSDTSGDVRPGARATAMAGAIVVPVFREDEVIGALGVANRAERTFTEEEVAELLAAGRALAAKPK
jgi:signal transduction protein with GAF and PtsI domain